MPCSCRNAVSTLHASRSAWDGLVYPGVDSNLLLAIGVGFARSKSIIDARLYLFEPVLLFWNRTVKPGRDRKERINSNKPPIHPPSTTRNVYVDALGASQDEISKGYKGKFVQGGDDGQMIDEMTA
ncbi:hypothetical protein C0Q70_14981 [Pomacea canaliculata]|uniref:Uncharacterized protein n=1 Tax=Pomacea canaliculata TaxID=400727 RepID=A0A2T7NTJ3_POMCA|nr:hypothetical protein C0Q70_14981 [Pomacea canaliculata]